MWALEPGTRHLNHGSFGAVLVEVLELQDRWRRRSEANPSRFVFRELDDVIDAGRKAVADFVGGDAEVIVPVRNATSGVAAVLRSIEPGIRAGDELLTTSHDYNAVRQILRFAAERTGARLVVARIPFPIADPAEVTQAVLDLVSDRTRLAVIDHVTSPTALVYPVEELVAALEPSVAVLVDGAHGPGQIPFSVDRIGASWYTGNLHKWVCAPKGAAFLHTRADRVGETVPAVISHGYNAPAADAAERYRQLFDWLGTDDFTPWAVVPDVIRLVGRLEPGGWEAVMKRNHELVLAGRRLIAESIGTYLPAPDDMIGTMASVPLPNGEGVGPDGELSPLMDELFEAGFACLVMNWPEWPRQLLRISAHLYNDLDDYRALAETLRRRLFGAA